MVLVYEPNHLTQKPIFCEKWIQTGSGPVHTGSDLVHTGFDYKLILKLNFFYRI